MPEQVYRDTARSQLEIARNEGVYSTLQGVLNLLAQDLDVLDQRSGRWTIQLKRLAAHGHRIVADAL